METVGFVCLVFGTSAALNGIISTCAPELTHASAWYRSPVAMAVDCGLTGVGWVLFLIPRIMKRR
jgi:hypothetical protein